MKEKTQIVIIGAGAAGIGFGITLEELGIKNYIILERGIVGNSFRNWPKETRFITPSFTSNGFGMPDLNAVSFETSPAYTLQKERLSGEDFAEYLDAVADGYKLKIAENTNVESIIKQNGLYTIRTNTGTIEAEYVICAVGEYTFPFYGNIKNAKENGLHYSQVNSWADISGDNIVIVGGNESGIDGLIHLVKLGKTVTLFTDVSGLDAASADPSIRLSPYTRSTVQSLIEDPVLSKNIHLVTDKQVVAIEEKDDKYLVKTNSDSVLSDSKPIICTGFKNGVLSLAPDFFETSEDGTALVNTFDESTHLDNIFLIGPSVRNGEAVFCYIYKFRQRFAVIAEEIARRSKLNYNAKVLDRYKKQAFYLNDCYDCAVLCAC